MTHKAFVLAITLFVFPLIGFADQSENLQHEVRALQQQTLKLQAQLESLQKQLVLKTSHKKIKKIQPEHRVVLLKKKTPDAKPTSTIPSIPTKAGNRVHNSPVTVHRLDKDPKNLEFYPTALVADQHVLTYIAGTPVVTSPYLGSRPAFDGSDYIVNISSINRDIRLMQQRRSLYQAYRSIGYPVPHKPIIAISGKVVPVATISGGPNFDFSTGDVSLGASEIDVAALLNDKVEAYVSVAVDTSPPDVGGQRLSNSSIDLNMGFVNIGNLDKTPFYFTGGQLYVPFGRYSTSMVSAPLTMIMARTKSRPFILGYKSKTESGPFAAVYGFRSDTTLGTTGTGGVNLGYVFDTGRMMGEVGVSGISSINDSGGMQFTGSVPGPTFGNFGGFSSPSNGSESVKKIPALGVHGYVSIDRYNFTAEWIGATGAFRTQDLSFNGQGAKPQAAQLEASVTFNVFDKPSTVGLGYQWSKETLALNLPQQRISGVFNISIWKDTVESLEYRHDINFNTTQYANGAAPIGQVNANTNGPGGASDTLLAQIGVYF